MMRWIVNYIDENQENWDKRREEQTRQAEKIDEEERAKGPRRIQEKQKTAEEVREERLSRAKALKEDWKKWRESKTAVDEEEGRENDKREPKPVEGETETEEEENERLVSELLDHGEDKEEAIFELSLSYL